MKRILTLAFCTLPLAAAAQEDDRGFLTRMLEENLSGAGRAVTITGFEGALSSQATMRELTIADDTGVWLTLRDVTLDWNRTALLAGRFSVNTLSAAEIVLARAPVTTGSDSLPTPEARAFALPELPVSINIGKLAAARIELGETVLGQPVEATLDAALSLAGGAGQATLDLQRTDAGPAGKFDLSASFSNETRVLAIDLEAIEGAGGIATTLLGLPGAPAIDLTVKGEGPLTDYTADIRLASDGLERLAGKVTLGAGEAAGDSRFAVDLGGDLAPLFLPAYAEFFGPSVTLLADGVKAADGRLTLDHLRMATQALTLDGSLALASDGLPERFAVTGTLGLDGKPVLLPLTTDLPTSVTHATLALDFDAAKGDGWTADLRMTGLDRADFSAHEATLTGGGTIARPEGKPLAEGTLDFSASGLAPADPALARALGDSLSGQFGFRWQEGQDVLALPALRITGADFGFDGGVTIAGLQSALTVKGQGTARADDLQRFADLAGQPLAGRATATLAGEAALLAGSFDLTGKIAGNGLKIGVAELDSLLSGASTIDLALRRDTTGTHLERLDLAAASLTAKAQGTIATAGSDIAADLDFRDLSALGGPYRGRLTGRARFTGTPQNGTVTLNSTGEGLAIGVAEVDSLLKGPATITAEAGIAGATVDLRKLQVKAASLGLDARGRIDPKGHDLSAHLAFTDLRALGGAYRGSLVAQANFKGTPADGALTATATGRGLAIGQTEADRLLAGETRLAADLALKAGQVKINTATLANPQLNVAAKGSIAGNQRQVRLEATIANLATLLPGFPGRLSVTGTALDDGRGYDLDLAAKGPGGIDGRVKGRVAGDFRSADLGITGRAQAGLANPFIDPATASGNVRYDLRLNGPLAPASLNGTIRLDGLRLAAAALPASIEGLGGAVTLARGQARLDLTGGVSSGGNFTVTGSAGLTAPYPGDIAIGLRQVILRDPQLYRSRINGGITVKGPLTGGAMIGGQIALGETELQVPSTGIGSAGGLDDLRHYAEPREVRLTRKRAGLIDSGGAGASRGGSRPFALDLLISAPQRIFVRGRGLDMEMGGELRVGGTTANVVPSGEFDLVRGRLDILGKRLTISEASLRLEGDFDPWLRVMASSESGGVTSSVQIEGNASEPVVSFVSQPELPEEEVLARLLFGRDLTSLSAFQAAQLASAVASLAGKGGVGILGKLRKGFGLDDFDVSTNAQGETTLTAGKYISKNAYTEVEVGRDNRTEIHLNLDLTNEITIRGTLDNEGETSLGIFKEKDY